MSSYFTTPYQSGSEEKDTPDSPQIQKQIFYYQKPLIWPSRKQGRRVSVPWSFEEDEYLTELVEKIGVKNWRKIQEVIYGVFKTYRSTEQISQHWYRVVNPQIIKGKWSQDEDQKLINAVRLCSPKQWKHIANQLSGRSDIQVRYRLERLKKQLLKHNILDQEFLP
ncbi:Myb-like DNA-binding domain-containing protein [Spironucleus salmonicida]|uniref:Myb-like DNA-binding domain-containing protein n=1 Tax=Spironucleus salmonicida TaxID=348837 RepID=V6LRY5_9EUKA|nr:Myb-like DNA-binding domain-containing protein [Spironucleus salmonicida]|eukprot:EST47023.1 Myb-like DNA-binding domain-containing protein [Spironucleus salmonicida]